MDNFYYLARSCLVKDETKFDQFDRIFAEHFKGIESTFKTLVSEVPDEWLRRQAELMLSEEERAQIEAMGGFEKLMEALRQISLRKGVTELDLNALPPELVREVPQLAIVGGYRKYMR